jgi:hypothetical protein
METRGHQPTYSNQTPNTAGLQPGSQSVGDNIHGQKGNNPDRQLRSRICAKFIRKSNCIDSQDVGLEAAII